MTINELREKRNQAWNAAKAFVETKRDKDGLLSDEDAATYAQMEKKVQDYSAEIERMEAMSAMEAQLNRPTSSPITEKPMNGKSTADEKPKTGRASDAYRTGMLTALRSNFHQVSDVLREGVDADGGYLVPEEYDSRLIQTLSEENIMRKLGHTITTSGEHKINIAATAPAAAWIEEGGALSFGDATFAQILLDAHKLHVAIKVTEELLYDNAFKLEDYILTEFGKALANAEEDAFLNGTGVGQPLGLFAETGGGHVAETLTAALKSDDLITLIHALKRPYRKSASFIMNDKTIEEQKMLRLVIISSNGNIFKNGNVKTLLSAKVYSWDEDITDTLDANQFIWTRVSEDTEADKVWNEQHFGGAKSVVITGADVKVRATFYCDLIDTTTRQSLL